MRPNQRPAVRRRLPVQRAFHAQADPVDRSPGHERPRRAVPQPAEQHRDHHVPVRHERALPVTAERDVDVVAQPAGERHVPAPPEVLQRDRGVRRVEVLRELEAEQQRDADRDVRVAAEVGEDLHGVRVDADQHLERRVAVRRCKDLVHDVSRQVIRDHHLQKEPRDDEHERARRVHLAWIAWRLELRQQLARAHDRAGDQVREERLEDRETRKRRGHELAPIGVDDVRDRHEREERDADRKRDADHPRRVEDVGGRVDEEPGVLEVHEQADVEPDREREQGLAGLRPPYGRSPGPAPS